MICYENIKTRVCQKLAFYVLLAIFMFWTIGYRLVIKMAKLGCAKSYLCIYYLQCLCFGVLAVWVSWLQYVCPGENNSQKKAHSVKIIFSLFYYITEFQKYSSKVH